MPMTAQLPPSLRDIPPLADADKMEFTAYDGFELQEAVWLRDLSNWARGNTLDDRQRVAKLFDWTVRNIELDRNSLERTPQMPWETLLLGHGTAMERAWVFILLARQQGIDAAVLATTIAPTGEPEASASGGKAHGRLATAPVPMADLRPWCAAVLIEGQLYLFDTALGLPIPAPGGICRRSQRAARHPACQLGAGCRRRQAAATARSGPRPAISGQGGRSETGRIARRSLAAVLGQADETGGVAIGRGPENGPHGEPQLPRPSG